MTYSVCVDSGGTKTLGILYDSNYHMVAQVRTGSLRDNCTSRELVEKHLRELISGLLDVPQARHITEIQCICGSLCSGEVLPAFRQRVRVLENPFGSECSLGLAAAGLREGVVALAGTGASMMMASRRYGSHSMGGYGAVVFDEGSGYHIGRMAMAAAIRAFEGRGEETLLLPRITRHLGADALPRGIFDTIYDPESHMSKVAWMASLSKITAEAAVDGDAVAAGILRTAGACIGSQVTALLRRYAPDDRTMPIVLSGSVYKGSRIVYDELCRVVREADPERQVLVPLFDPVVGGIMLDYLRTHESFDEATKERFLEEYGAYRFELGI